MVKKRTTVYLDSKVLKMLKLRSIRTDESISQFINDLVYEELVEEMKDLAGIEKVLDEPSVPFDKVLKELGLEDEVQD